MVSQPVYKKQHNTSHVLEVFRGNSDCTLLPHRVTTFDYFRTSLLPLLLLHYHDMEG